jgi:tetratricopeptide (TPR) repeat protein
MGAVPLPGMGAVPLPGAGPSFGAPAPAPFGASGDAAFGGGSPFSSLGSAVPLPSAGAVPLPGASPFGAPAFGAVPLPGASPFGGGGAFGAPPIAPPGSSSSLPSFGSSPVAPPTSSFGDIFGSPPPPPAPAAPSSKSASMADIFGDLGGNSSGPARASAFHGDNSVVVQAAQPQMAGGLLDFIDDAGRADAAPKQEQFRVRKRSGRVLGPFDAQVVLQMFAKGELLGSEEGSLDGVNWKPLGQFPAFAETIQRAMASALGGMDDLPAPKGAIAAPASAVVGELAVGTSDLLNAEKAKEEVERRRRNAADSGKRKALVFVSAASVVAVVGVVGAGLNFGTPYGWFGIKYFFPDPVVEDSRPSTGPVVDALPPLPSFGDEVDPAELFRRDTYVAYRQAAEQFARVVEARKAVVPFPDDGKKAAAEQARALAYVVVVEDLPGFLPQLQAALALAPGGDEQSLAIAQAGAAYAQGKWEDGMKLLRPLADPARSLTGNKLAEVHTWIGLGLRGSGNADGAMKKFDEALQANPRSPIALGLQASLLARTGGRAFALEYVDKVLAEHADHARSLILKGNLLIGESSTTADGKALLVEMSEGPRSKMASPAQQAEAYMGRAELAISARAFPEGLRYLGAAVALVPTNRALRVRAVEFALRLREYSIAREHAKALLAQIPDDPDGVIGLARAKLGTNDKLGAFTDLQVALKKHPEDAMLNFWFGVASKEMGKLTEARALFDKAQKLDPKRADPVVENVSDAIERGKLSDALQIADAALNGVDSGERHRVRSAKATVYARRRQFPEAETEFKKALEENPRDSDTRAHYAELLVAMKRLPDAEQQVNEAISMDGKNPSVLIASGAIAESRGELKQARDRYEEAMQLAPNAFEPYARAAVVASKLKDLQRARSLVETASQLRPTNPDVIAAQAVVLSASDPKQASQMLTTASEAAPEDPKMPFLLGQIFQTMGANLEAIDALKRATSIAPDYDDAWFTLGKVNRDLGRLGDARASFANVIRIDGTRADAWVETADLLAAQGDDDGALEAYEKALKAEPSNPNSICAMGDTLVVRMGEDAKNLKRGIELLERCVKLTPKHPTAWKNLGNAYRTNNRRKEAANAYKQHLSQNINDPDNPIIMDMLEDVGGKMDK